MEEFLPIIIGIIWLAYTIYNKGQKKKNVRKPVSTEKDESSAPTLLEQILLGKEPSESQPYETSDSFIETIEENIEDTEEVTTTHGPEPFLHSELTNFVQKGQKAIIEDEDALGIEIIEDTELEKYLVDFDLQKAVILSEILKAPYIDYK